MRFRILTYNIHKGFSIGNRRFILDQIKRSIVASKADLVHLQEVGGLHHGASHFEFLADQTWPHFAYGKNAVHTRGHHGNAILSKFPIVSYENQDVSLNRYEKRGLLHATIHTEQAHPLHAFSMHLNLRENDRIEQINRLSDRLARLVPEDAPLILAGDFNDWRKNVTPILHHDHGMKEAFVELTGKHARTFPSFLPMLPLDRIYYRNLDCRSVSVLRDGGWNEISDHLPIVAEFETFS
jgi:endonuclease/exonuclease/phosphatase family metal-dependent hydrolase